MPPGIDRYPDDPNDPIALFQGRLREMQREIDELKSARGGGIYGQVIKDAAGNNRITMDAAGIKLYDATGVLLLQIGDLGGGDVGFRIVNENGRQVLRLTQHGNEFPRVGMPWGGFPWWASTTQAAYSGAEAFRCDFDSTADKVQYDIQADPQGGTMDFIIQVKEYGIGSVMTTAVNQVNANAQNQGMFTIPAACLIPGTGTDPRGRSMTLRVEAKRTSGANPVLVRFNASPLNVSS